MSQFDIDPGDAGNRRGIDLFRFKHPLMICQPRSTGSSTKLPTGLRSKSDVFRVELRRAPDFEWMSVNR